MRLWAPDRTASRRRSSSHGRAAGRRVRGRPGCRRRRAVGRVDAAGFVHDICSAVHPLRHLARVPTLPLAQHGLEWVEPPAMLAHPFDDGRPRLSCERCDRTAASLGAIAYASRSSFDRSWTRGRAWRPRARPSGLPRHPFAVACFGLRRLRSAPGLATDFTGAARALFAGVAAHGMLPLEHAVRPLGLVLGARHTCGLGVPARRSATARRRARRRTCARLAARS